MVGALVPGHLMNVASVSCGDGEAQALGHCCHCTNPVPCPLPPARGTHRAVLRQRLDAARVVVLHAAAGAALPVPLALDEALHLPVLADAGRELGPQVDQVDLEGGGAPGDAPGGAPTSPARSCPPEPTPGPPEDGRWAGTWSPPASHGDAAAPGAAGGAQRDTGGGPGSRLGQGLLPCGWGRGLPPLGSGWVSTNLSSYRAGPDPEVFLLDVLDAFIHAFVPQHLPSEARVTQPAAGGAHPAPVPPPAGAEPRFVPPITVPPGRLTPALPSRSSRLHPSPLCKVPPAAPGVTFWGQPGGASRAGSS